MSNIKKSLRNSVINVYVFYLDSTIGILSICSPFFIHLCTYPSTCPSVCSFVHPSIHILSVSLCLSIIHMKANWRNHDDLSKNFSIHLQRKIMLCYTAIISLWLKMNKYFVSSNTQSYSNFLNQASKLLRIFIVVLWTIIQSRCEYCIYFSC